MGSLTTDAQIKAHLIRHWKSTMWGLMDCDRCVPRMTQKRSGPCDSCPRWPHWIAEWRKRRASRKGATT